MNTEIKDKYINPYTDFGFKKLFGTDINKELLISFLNAVFNGEQIITDLQYRNNEHLGTCCDERKAIFDVYCETERGEKIIVEMQNAAQQYFKDRSVYYATFPIQEQAKPGDWNFELKHVYTIGIINFTFENEATDNNPRHHVQLLDTCTHKVFYDKLTFIYLEMPKFNKTEDELVSMYDKWLYVLRNLSRLQERPRALQERVFTRLFEQAEIAKYSPAELRNYEISFKAYRDLCNIVDYTSSESLAKGIEIGTRNTQQSNIQRMHAMNMSAETIACALGMPIEEVKSALHNLL